MSTHNDNNDPIEDDDAQWTDEEVEEQEDNTDNTTATAVEEKSSPDLTLPVEQVERTKRSSMELSQWRAVMAAPEHTTRVAQRWYLQESAENPGEIKGYAIPQEPSVITSGTSWAANLDLDTTVEVGWYWIVVCMSLKNLDISKTYSVIIDGLRKDRDQDEWLWTENSCETVLRTAELDEIPKDDYTRIRMHRQINIEDLKEAIQLRINVTNEDDKVNAGSVEVHYIELGANAFDSPIGVKDCVLYGDGTPDYFISVGADDTSQTRAVNVHSFYVSDTRNYATTLHFTPGEGHINVWDLSPPANYEPANKRSRPITKPIAQVSFRVSPYLTAPAVMKYYSAMIAISSAGTQVAVGSEIEVAHGIPFQVFQTPSTTGINDKDSYQPRTLTRVTSICPSLISYIGVGAFHRIDLSNTDEKDERYVVFNGITLEVYETESWCRIYRLELGPRRGDEFTLGIQQSLRGRYFCWNGCKGVISIWNIETGRIASNIFIEEDRADNYASLSPDGSKVAISVKGTIQIYDTITGIKMGTYREGLDSDNIYGLILEQDYFVTTNRNLSNSSVLGNPNMRSVVRVRDMGVVEDHYMHEDYRVLIPHNGHVPLFIGGGGSVVNFLSLGDILYPKEEQTCGINNNCEVLDRVIDIFYIGSTRTYVSSEDVSFTVYSDQEYVSGELVHTLKIGIGSSSEEMTDTMTIAMGKVVLEHRAFWVSETSQLFLMAEGYLYVWTLSNSNEHVATLDRIIKFLEDDPARVKDTAYTDMTKVKMCEHGCQFTIEVKATSWASPTAGFSRPPTGTPNNVLTFPKSAVDTFPTSQEYRDEMGVLGAVKIYPLGTKECKEEIIRFLKNRIRPSREHPLSCLVTLCRAWTADDRIALERIMTELLPTKFITWIPDPHEDKSTEPLAILLEIGQTRPRVFGVAKVVMKYCVSHANQSKNLAFLSPLFGSMHEVMELYPEEALECMGRIAFIPVKNRAYIVDNHILALPPRPRLRFWEPRSKPLVLTNDPIMQFHFSGDKPDDTNDGFTRPVFMASFDALWYYKDQQQTELKKDGFQAASNTATTTWWKTLYHMFRLKCHIQMPAVVECYDFNLEFLDNPAIAALVSYKWNTIGFTYWLFRFIFQCIFYALVVIAALMQVYYSQQSQMVGLFIAIIVMGAVFLWLELLQAVHSFTRYSGSISNYLDMFAFALPLIGSAFQLNSISSGDKEGHTRIMSASVLAVFMHMLFELRVFKSVCKYVMIIQQTVLEIRAFFFIFAGGLFAFAIATEHLLRACTIEGCEREKTDFPENFLGAMSATYFFLGGRYDPVSPLFESDDWGFHIMMAVFFFFTVIVMLNVLIALINVAFTKGDDGWRLAWIESRLRYIEAAENMSHQIPGFRQTHNWFPKQIYFSATPQQVKDYQEKYHPKDKPLSSDEALESWKGVTERGWAPTSGDDDDDEVGDEVDALFNNVPRDAPSEDQEEESGDGEAEGEGEDGEGEGEGDDAAGDENEDGDDEQGEGEDEEERKAEDESQAKEQPEEDSNENDGTDTKDTKKKSSKKKTGKIETTTTEGEDNDKDKGKDKDISRKDESNIVYYLKQQVGDLQRQLSLQQEQSQKQFDELKALLLQLAKTKTKE
ncbi:hypothetical protein BGX23_011818 [Mortierella sp. AD031]|nr:hypothetical protein BGX23_011818 [Mortierella sp. AD031]